MSSNHTNTFPSLDLPNSNRFIEGAGDDEIGLRIEIHAEHEIGMAFESFEAVKGGASVPDTERAIIRGGADVVGIGGPSKIGDALRVALEAMEEGEGRGRPDD